MIKKLRLKFVMINMTIVTMMLCAILGLVFYFTRENLETESIGMLHNIAENPFPQEVPGALEQDVRLPFFVVRHGVKGDLITTNGGYYDLSDRDFLNRLMEEVAENPKTFGVLKDYHLRYYRLDTPVNKCIAFVDISSEQATLSHLTRSCLLIGVLGFFLFLWISFWLSGWAVRPVEQAMRQQRQFVADASHELKTPLTVIMTNAELMKSGDYPSEKEGQFLSGILTVSRQMRGLVEQMLELARTDLLDVKETFTQINLSELLEEELLNFEPVFYEAGLSLQAEIEPELRIEGNEEKLRRLPGILLDNAGKYVVKGGKVEVSLKKLGRKHCLLTVSNEGKELSPDECRQIFKRFYRMDGVRSRSGSYGLGLSIAENIVNLHHGRIWAESRDGWNHFRIRLPLV